MRVVMAGETPVWGRGAVQRWIALLDAAEAALRAVSPHAPLGQRTAGRTIDALFAYEHQMTPLARRRAREQVWQRDRPSEPLPPIRGEWEACRCTACRYEQRTGQPSARRRIECPVESRADPRKEAA